MNEIQILLQTIDNYMQIADINSNTEDDVVSTVALLFQYKKQYPEYTEQFDNLLKLYRQNGYIDLYNESNNNVAKNIFLKYGTNYQLAHDYIYDYIEGCSCRFVHYLIIIGLIGKPTTKLKRRLLAEAFSFNSCLFCKQSIYYNELYIKKGFYFQKDIRSLIENLQYFKVHKAVTYSYLGDAYHYDKNYIKALENYNISYKIDKRKKVLDKIEKTQRKIDKLNK